MRPNIKNRMDPIVYARTLGHLDVIMRGASYYPDAEEVRVNAYDLIRKIAPLEPRFVDTEVWETVQDALDFYDARMFDTANTTLRLALAQFHGDPTEALEAVIELAREAGEACR